MNDPVFTNMENATDIQDNTIYCSKNEKKQIPMNVCIYLPIFASDMSLYYLSMQKYGTPHVSTK